MMVQQDYSVRAEGGSFSIPIDAFASIASGSGTSDDSSKEEIKRLRLEHSLYGEHAKRWEFYQSAYEGGEAFANTANLFRHVRENEFDFSSRAERVHNLNLCMPLVDFFTNFIFSESIDRDGGANKDVYKDFIANVNLKNETVDDFMRQVCDDMQIYGMDYIQVDSPALLSSDGENSMETEPPLVTKQDEQDRGTRPYWVHICPIEVTDWQVDRFGALIYMKRKQLDSQFDKTDGKLHNLELYTEFYPDRYVLSKVDASAKDEEKFLGSTTVPNTQGVVPVVVVRFKRSKAHPHMGLSFLRDFAYNNREIMNLTSLIQEFLYRQCFNILAKETDSGIPLREQEDGAIGSSNVMDFPRGARAPAYISPPSAPAKFLQDERQRITTSMYLRASQDTMNELFNGEKSSGDAQGMSFSKTVPFISSRADTLERAETALMRLTMKFWSRKDWDGKIKYKDRYELTNLTSALTQLQILVRDFQIPSELFVKSQLKRMVHEYDGKMPVEDQETIEQQIDSMDFKGWQADQRDAFLGTPPEGKPGTATGISPKSSPAAQQKPKQETNVLQTHETDGGGATMSETTKLHE